ncbi:hypothetical protein JXB11_04545 [Candidatus Woesearchaeota archaeon]|nr:hypothetical protein [Candidatus Woesearchaeota archaeon]
MRNTKGKPAKRQESILDHKPTSADLAYRRTANMILYWSTILFLTLMNVLIALVLTPFLFASETPQLYLMMVIFGLLFGYIFNLLITRIEFLERHHHFFAAIFIPLIAIITILTIISSIDHIASILNITISQDPKITVLVYGAAFMLPYTLGRIKEIHK